MWFCCERLPRPDSLDAIARTLTSQAPEGTIELHAELPGPSGHHEGQHAANTLWNSWLFSKESNR
jgi:hypothetical protein